MSHIVESCPLTKLNKKNKKKYKSWNWIIIIGILNIVAEQPFTSLNFTSLHFICPEVCKTEKVAIKYKYNILGVIDLLQLMAKSQR